MNIKATALAAVLALTLATAGHAAEAMDCCKGETCCCKKAKEDGGAKPMDHGGMDHGTMDHGQPAPQPK